MIGDTRRRKNAAKSITFFKMLRQEDPTRVFIEKRRNIEAKNKEKHFDIHSSGHFNLAATVY